ncbi:hypothetical protein SOVF_167910 [Spinacia oleracea]|nr:hypothetical protein SOVF_167910 [Spinacia oleracea]
MTHEAAKSFLSLPSQFRRLQEFLWTFRFPTTKRLPHLMLPCIR